MAATAAYAQSTVELYGRAEITGEFGRKTTTTSTTTINGVKTVNPTTQLVTGTDFGLGVFPAKTVKASQVKPQLAINDGNTTGDGSSRIGFRGTEDLGGGLRAVFQFEAGVNTDDGSSGNGGGNLFSRTAMVGVTGGFGRLTAGRQLNPAFSVQAMGSAMGTMNTIDAHGATAPFAGGVRSSSSVMYTTPNMAGLTVSALYAAAEDKGTVREGANVVTTNNKPGISIGVNYSNGPLYIGLGWDKRENQKSTNVFVGGASVSSSATTNDQVVLSASYDLGILKPFLSYTQFKADASAAEAGAVDALSGKEKAWALGFTAPMGAGLLFAELGSSKTGSISDTTRVGTIVTNNLAGQSVSGKETAFSLGYRYSLSKRTFTQVAYHSYKAEANWAEAAAKESIQDLTKRSGLALTLSHAF